MSQVKRAVWLQHGYGVAGAFAFWVGWNTGAFIYQSGPAISEWLANTTMGQYMSSYWSYMGGAFGFGGASGAAIFVMLRRRLQ